MSIENTLDDFAANVAKAASGDKVSLGEKTDALKALTGYYAARQKHVKKPDEEEDEGEFNFGQSQEPANGSRGPAVHPHRNS